MSDTPIETVQNPLAKHFTAGALLQFALPTMVMMVFMGLYTLGDTVILSRYVNTDALSAVNIVTPAIQVIVGLGSMLASGGSAIVAMKMGQGNARQASRDFTLLVIAGVLLGVFLAIAGTVYLDALVWRLGASERLFLYCKSYLFILLLFTPASILQILFQSLIVTAGKPGFGMALSVSAGVVNIVLDYLFIVHLNMGIAGAALGTGIGYLLPGTIGIVFFARTKGDLRFEKPVADLRVLWESCANGFSETVSQIAAAATTFLFNLVMMRFLGEDGVAAITIIVYTQFLLTTLYIGFSMGVAPIVSYHYGSREHARLKKIFRMSLGFIGVASALIFVAALSFGPSLVGFFSPKGTPVYQIAKDGFLLFSVSFLFCGFNIFASAAFTALSNGKVSAAISMLRTFVFISIALWILPKIFHVVGVWIAVPVAELLTTFVSIAFIFKNQRRYHY